MREGDIIVFSGQEIISWWIKFFTGSPITHCAMVRQRMHQNGPFDVLVTESTISKRNGPQTNPLGEILSLEYVGGQAEWLQLDDDIYNTIDFQKFYEFIGAMEDHAKYDVEGLVLYAAKYLPFIGPFIQQSPDPHQMFCDAWCIAIFEACGVLRGINPRKMAPKDLAQMKLYKKAVPILGEPMVIKHFNTL